MRRQARGRCASLNDKNIHIYNIPTCKENFLFSVLSHFLYTLLYCLFAVILHFFWLVGSVFLSSASSYLLCLSLSLALSSSLLVSLSCVVVVCRVRVGVGVGFGSG
jgi:hypothetical protein